MKIPDVNNLIFFILFFVPGFISIKIYDFLVLGERRDFSKSFAEAIGYSCLNYGAFSWLLIIIHSNNFQVNNPILYFIFIFLILFIFPIIWPILFLGVLKFKPLKRYFNKLIPKPWDYVFLKREPFWIIIHLKNGNRVAGIYDMDSFASLYPVEEQIYLQQVWRLDKNGKFIEAIERSRGVIVMREEIALIEFFK
ncbi:MAG: hypothetical protein JXI43_13420 [Tissierellales bacterium]|nr:hypothetical protein [Tissierellales bacterium]